MPALADAITFFSAQAVTGTSATNSRQEVMGVAECYRAFITLSLGSFTTIIVRIQTADDAGNWYNHNDCQVIARRHQFSAGFTGCLLFGANESTTIALNSTTPYLGFAMRAQIVAAGTTTTPGSVTCIVQPVRLTRQGRNR